MSDCLLLLWNSFMKYEMEVSNCKCMFEMFTLPSTYLFSLSMFSQHRFLIAFLAYGISLEKFSLYELWRKNKFFVCLVIRIEHCFAFVCFLPQRVVLWLVFVSTFCFCLTWQFNQFVLLVQALIIFTLDCLDFLTAEQVTLKDTF